MYKYLLVIVYYGTKGRQIMCSISDVILNRIQKTIDRYSLISGKEVFVADSGGKDSLFLCIALQELGYQVYPIIIDIGYNSNWSNAIEIAKNNNLDVLLLNSEVPIVAGLNVLGNETSMRFSHP